MSKHQAPLNWYTGGGSDTDVNETEEWLTAFEQVVEIEGRDRACFLLKKLLEKGYEKDVVLPFTGNTPYINTIAKSQEPAYAGDRQLERRIKSIVRWNAMAMVVRANKKFAGLGGHISTFASSATLYQVGFHHFFRGRGDGGFDGDVIYFQGHGSPGVYAHAFLEGRISIEQMEAFRRELETGGGLSSYPHPWLMQDFWEVPTVSMGLGPISAIYQAKFNRYLRDRGLRDPQQRKVWAFLGDGETDEPEALGAITLAAREKLDNLIFVVNCNLQRLDGPVRGNGKIIQELETAFRGAGWNVIKVIWGSDWDPLIEADNSGRLIQRMTETLDGEYQKYVVEPGSYIRKEFFGKYPELLELVKSYSDDQLRTLRRGGHDPVKVHAAFKSAVEHEGSPTVILAKTVKGYGLGEAGEGKNVTHQQKKLTEDELRFFRDRFDIPVSDRDLSRRAVLLPAGKQPGGPVSAGAPPSPGRAGADAEGPQGGPADPRRDGRLGALLRGGGPRRLDDHGVRPDPDPAPQGQRDRQEDRAHRARRGAHVRHGVAVPPVRHLLPRRPALRAGGQVHAPLLPRGHGRADPGRGDHRGGLHGVVHRRRHLLRHPWHRHAAVLHLLLDVRLPAGGRPHLGRGRPAHPRFPAGRHRPAARRSTARASSMRTATATCWRAWCRTFRPTIRPTPSSWR